MNEDKKYQVFISSTHDDLIEERQKVFDAVLTLCQIPIGMEMFSAEDEDQWEIIKSHIDDTDYYVLIIANRYGSVIKEGPDAGISYTEKEYNYAVSQGVPVLAYLIDESVPVKPSFVEKENIDKLKAFKEKVCQGREVVWWKSPDELAAKVSQSLFKQIRKDKRPGWVRTKSTDYIRISSILSAGDDVKSSPRVTNKTEPKDKDNSAINNGISSIVSIAEEVNVVKEKESEIYSIYLKQVRPNYSLSSDPSFDYKYKKEIREALLAVFDALAKYRVHGNEEQLDVALSSIIQARNLCNINKCLTMLDRINSIRKPLLSSRELSDIKKYCLYRSERVVRALERVINYSSSDDQIEQQMYEKAKDEYESFCYWLRMEY